MEAGLASVKSRDAGTKVSLDIMLNSIVPRVTNDRKEEMASSCSMGG